MKIGIVCYPTYGGSGVVATELGKGLAQKGHSVHFITYSQPARLLSFTENVYYHEVSSPDYPLFEYTPYETALPAPLGTPETAMNIHEYQAKALLKEYGALVSEGRAIMDAKDAKAAAEELGGPIWVVKSQIHAGGRGKGKFKGNESGGAACAS